MKSHHMNWHFLCRIAALHIILLFIRVTNEHRWKDQSQKCISEEIMSGNHICEVLYQYIKHTNCMYLIYWWPRSQTRHTNSKKQNTIQNTNLIQGKLLSKLLGPAYSSCILSKLFCNPPPPYLLLFLLCLNQCHFCCDRCVHCFLPCTVACTSCFISAFHAGTWKGKDVCSPFFRFSLVGTKRCKVLRKRSTPNIISRYCIFFCFVMGLLRDQNDFSSY